MDIVIYLLRKLFIKEVIKDIKKGKFRVSNHNYNEIMNNKGK